MKNFIKGIFSEENGVPSWKRVAGMFLVLLLGVEVIANIFFHKDVEPTLKNQVYYLLTTFVGAIVVEKVGVKIAGNWNKDENKDLDNH